MATPTRTIIGIRFFKKAIRNFIKNKIIYPMSYYYTGGGIGTQNLLKRYSTYVPLNPQYDSNYFYVKVVDNKLSEPPFPYIWLESNYIFKINVTVSNSNILVPVQIPFDKIEYGGVTFDIFGNWRVIDTTSPDNELFRNGYIRVKKTDIDSLTASVGGLYNSNIYLNYKEVWGTGVFPTGVTYIDNSITTSGWYLPIGYKS